MATISLNVSNRDGRGKGAARKLRAAGQVPAIVYGRGQNATSVAVDPRSIELGFASTRDPNTLVALAFDDGSTRTCLVRDVQRHPVSQAIEHVDFYEVAPDQELTLSVPVVTTGRAAGTRVGGNLKQLVRRLTVRSLPASIPSTIEIDVSPLNVGQSLKVSELTPPPGTSFVYRKDFAVVEVEGKRVDEAAGKGA